MKLTRFVIYFLTLTLAGSALKTMLFGNLWRETIEFEQSDEVLINPMIGYAPNAEYEEVAKKYSLVYVDVTWRELEPEEGVYDFSSIDEENLLTRWRSEGKRVVFRFVLDKPGDVAHLDIPDWLYEKIDGDGVKYNNSYGLGFSPAYDNEIIIEAHAKAIKALGEYYGGDDFFAYVELGSLGHWGEWHVNYESGIDRLPNENIRELYIKPYIAAFPHSQILMRRSFTPVKTYGFGVFNDMTGDEEATVEWIDWLENGGEYTQTGEKNAIVAVDEVWNSTAVGGEFTSSVSMDYLLRYHLDDTLKLVQMSHMSFIGPKMPTKDIYADGAGEVLKSVGYRFRIQEAKIGKNFNGKVLKVNLSWINDGVAPIYWDWDAYVYLVDQDNTVIEKELIDLDLTTLTGGKTTNTKTIISLEYAAGKTCKVCIGICDPITGEPAIMFAMDTERVGNMSVLYELKN